MKFMFFKIVQLYLVVTCLNSTWTKNDTNIEAIRATLLESGKIYRYAFMNERLLGFKVLWRLLLDLLGD
jgi:hypothetical protein